MTENVKKLKELRTSIGMSQVSFAKEFGIPVRTIEDWESGKRAIKDYIIALLYRVSRAEGKIE